MNNPWKDPNYPTLDFTKHKVYSASHNQRPVEAKSSEILFCGSCDIAGIKKEKYWYEIYCEKLNLNCDDYVKIGSIGQPMQALVRKIYAWLKLVDKPPKKIFMVAPVAMPEQILSKTAWPVPRTLDIIPFFARVGVIPPEVLSRIIPLIVAQRQVSGPGHLLYEFCQNFSFLEMMTKAYGIELRWTPNLTRKAVEYYKDLDIYLEEHDFAKKTFIGYDHSTVDLTGSGLDFPNKKSHVAISDRFLLFGDK